MFRAAVGETSRETKTPWSRTIDSFARTFAAEAKSLSLFLPSLFFLYELSVPLGAWYHDPDVSGKLARPDKKFLPVSSPTHEHAFPFRAARRGVRSVRSVPHFLHHGSLSLQLEYMRVPLGTLLHLLHPLPALVINF